MSRPVGAPAFDVLWGIVLPGQSKPAVLQCASPGSTADERAMVVATATQQLRAAGHLEPLGVAEETVCALTVLARPALAVDVRLFERVPVDAHHPTGIRKVGMRVAVAGARGAAAVLGPTEFTVWSFQRGELVSQVAGLFVKHDPPRRFSGLTVEPGDPRRRTDATLRLLAGPFLRRAHLCASTTDHVVRRTTMSSPLTLNDTDAGRFLVFPDRNLLVIAPGNRMTLERKLREMTEFS